MTFLRHLRFSYRRLNAANLYSAMPYYQRLGLSNAFGYRFATSISTFAGCTWGPDYQIYIYRSALADELQRYRSAPHAISPIICHGAQAAWQAADIEATRRTARKAYVLERRGHYGRSTSRREGARARLAPLPICAHKFLLSPSPPITPTRPRASSICQITQLPLALATMIMLYA